MPLIDLSAPIRPDPPELPEVLRTDISYDDHAAGAAAIQTLFGVGARAAPRRRGLGHRDVHALRHPQQHPRGRAVALQLDDRRAPCGDHRRAPARVVPGAGPGDRRDRSRGRRGAHRRGSRGARAAHARGARHRAGAHRPRRVLRAARLHRARPRRDGRRHPVALRARGAGDGHRRLGLGRASTPPGRAREGRGPGRRLLGGAPVRPRLLADRAAREPRRPAAPRVHGRPASRCGSWAAAPRPRAWWPTCPASPGGTGPTSRGRARSAPPRRPTSRPGPPPRTCAGPRARR